MGTTTSANYIHETSDYWVSLSGHSTFGICLGTKVNYLYRSIVKLSRRSLLEQQKQLCAGCGMYIDSVFAHRLRYCEYLGKLHCTGCHRSQISTIPARVLDRYVNRCDNSYHNEKLVNEFFIVFLLSVCLFYNIIHLGIYADGILHVIRLAYSHIDY